jgi:inositol 1,4,5-triphosphate receptor type 1/inositol 1,4,5-triphosphate receptor type 3
MALLGGQEVNYKAIKEALMEERKLLFPKARDFFVGHTKHIEVLREDKNIEKTYFYIPPFCLHLDKENKTRFNESADRVSNKAKVTSLQKESEDIIRVMKLNFKIQLLLDKFKVLAVIVENIQLLRDFEFLLALVINLLIFLEYKKLDITDYSNKDVDPGDPTTRKFSNEDDFRYQELINQMGLLSIVLSGIIVAFFLSRNAPLLIEKAWVGVVTTSHLSSEQRQVQPYRILDPNFQDVLVPAN